MLTPHTTPRKLSLELARWARWLHIYVSMFGLAVVLFFSATGVTLNHPDWFFGELQRSSRSEGRLNPAWLGSRPADSDPPAEITSGAGEVSRLEIVEHMRQAHGIRGALTEFRVDDAECVVAFKGPGYSADVFIDRESGEYSLTQTFHGIIGVLNDLHKGRDTGPVWSVLIDVSSIVLVFISLTGLILIFYLKLRRGPGLLIAVLGTLVLVAIVYWGVP